MLVVPLAITATVNLPFYIEYRANLGDFGDKPLSYFSLSEFIFVVFPDLIIQISFSLKDINIKVWFMCYIENCKLSIRSTLYFNVQINDT